MPMLPQANSVNGNPMQHPLQKLSSHDANTTAALSSNAHMSNSSSAIGMPASSYSGKGAIYGNAASRVATGQNSPMMAPHVSEQQLQIDVTSS